MTTVSVVQVKNLGKLCLTLPFYLLPSKYMLSRHLFPLLPFTSQPKLHQMGQLQWPLRRAAVQPHPPSPPPPHHTICSPNRNQNKSFFKIKFMLLIYSEATCGFLTPLIKAWRSRSDLSCCLSSCSVAPPLACAASAALALPASEHMTRVPSDNHRAHRAPAPCPQW